MRVSRPSGQNTVRFWTPYRRKSIRRPTPAYFLNWSQLVAGHLAAGKRNERIRGYLKSLAKESWDLVNWVTHAADVTKVDGTLAIDASHLVIEAFGAALIRHERKMPERCGRCNSLRLQLVYMPELENDTAICQACGFLMAPDDTPESPIAIPLKLHVRCPSIRNDGAGIGQDEPKGFLQVVSSPEFIGKRVDSGDLVRPVRLFSPVLMVISLIKSAFYKKAGGERGIRTPDRAFDPITV